MTSAGHTVYEANLPASTAEVLIRAVVSGQRTIALPADDAVSAAALVDLRALLTQLDSKVTELAATAGAQAQSHLPDEVESHLNIPVRALLAELPPVYDQKH